MSQRGLLGDGRTVLAFLLLGTSLVFFFSLFEFNHNDHLYSVAALSSGHLYDDVHYVQAPGGFYFWKMVGALAPESCQYICFRLVSLGSLLFSIALVLLLLLRDNLARITFLLFVCASQSLMETGAQIGTYSIALFLVTAGIVSLQVFQDPRLSLLVSGLAFGLAASMKLNHLLLLLPVGAWALYRVCKNVDAGYRMQSLAALSLGALVGLAPTLFHFVQAPETFLLHNVDFHTDLTRRFRDLSSFDILQALYRDMRQFGYQNGTVISLSIYGLIGLARQHRAYGMFLLGATVTALVMAVTPLLTFPEYFAPASFLCATAASFVFMHRGRRYRIVFAWAVLPVLALSMIGNLQLLVVRAMAQEGQPDLIRVLRVQRQLRAYASRVDGRKAQCSEAMFSYSGALVVDSGFSPTRYMESGVFWRRLDGLVPERYLVEGRLDPFLLQPAVWVDQMGIDFLLVGLYKEQEGALVAYARIHGFEERIVGHVSGKELRLLYDPACLKGTG